MTAYRAKAAGLRERLNARVGDEQADVAQVQRAAARCAVEARRDDGLCAGRRLRDQPAAAPGLHGVAAADAAGHELRRSRTTSSWRCSGRTSCTRSNPATRPRSRLSTYPGRIIKTKVDSIIWAQGQGQLPLTGTLPQTGPAPLPEGRFAVKLVLDEREKGPVPRRRRARHGRDLHPSSRAPSTSFARCSCACTLVSELGHHQAPHQPALSHETRPLHRRAAAALRSWRRRRAPSSSRRRRPTRCAACCPRRRSCRRLEVAGGAAGVVATEWVQTFGDPQLEALVDEGLLNNLDLKAAAARVDVAAGLVVQARSLLYPQRRHRRRRRRGGTRLHEGSLRHRRGDLVGAGSVGTRAGAGRVGDGRTTGGRCRPPVRAPVAGGARRHAVVPDAGHASGCGSRRRMPSACTTICCGWCGRATPIGQVGAQDVALAGADLFRARQRERAFATLGAADHARPRARDRPLPRRRARAGALICRRCRRRCRPGCRPNCWSGVPISSPPSGASRQRST